jgi:tape measure domain-containing protein
LPSTAGGLFIQVKLQTDQAERALKRLGREFGRAVDPEKIIGDSSRVLLRELKTLEGGYKAIATASVAQARQTEAAAKVQVAQAQAATRTRQAELKVVQEQIRAESRLATVAAQDSAIRGRQTDARARAEVAKAAREQAKAVEEVARAQQREAKAQDALNARQARQQEARRLGILKQQKQALDDLRRAEERLAGVRRGSGGKVATEGAQELFVGLGAARSGNYFYGLAALARYFKNVSAASRDYARSNQEAANRQNELRIAAQRYVAAGGDVASLTDEAKNALTGIAAVGGRASGALAGVGGALPAIAAAAAILLPVIVALVAQFSLLYIGLGKIAPRGVQVAASFELLRSQLIGLIGDTQAAAREYGFLLALGQQSLIPTDQLIAADRALVSFGVTNQRIRTNLVKFISDFGTATGATQVQIDNLAFALGQVASTGKVTAQDLRQFGNAGVNVALVVDQIGKNTQQSSAKVREGLSAGTISAEEFYKALIQINDVRFAPAAVEAAKTTTGLFQNLKDTIKTLLGETFRQLGVLDPIREFLLFLTTWVKNNKDLFVPIAAAVRDFFNALVGGAAAKGSEFTGIMNALAFVLRVAIPAAIRIATAFVTGLRLSFLAVWPVIRIVIATTIGLFRSLVTSVQGASQGSGNGLSILLQVSTAVFGGIIAGIGVLIAGFFTLQAVVIGVVKAIRAALTLDFQGVANAVNGIGTAISNGFKASTAIVSTYIQAVKDAGNVKLPKPMQFGEQQGQGAVNASKPGPDVDTKAAEEAAKRIAEARNSLYELLRSLFGQPSDALKGLYGDANKFTATVDSIVSTATRLRDAIRQAAPGARGKEIALFIDEQTKRLIILARRRERVAKQLEAAQKRLDDLVAARADLAKQIKDSARSFVNSLSLGEETVNTFRRIDAVGSFITTEKKQTKSFVQSMRDRLAEYRKFMANIRKLQKAGLDPKLVRDFIEAGPEAAGDAVGQLAGAGQDTIDEVNAIQSELNRESSKFAEKQADIYYKTGIDNAQAQVDGLKSQIAVIDQTAKDIAQTIIDAVAPYAKKSKQAGVDIATGLDDGLGDGSALGAGWADDVISSIGNGLDFSGLTGSLTDALKGIEDQFKDAGPTKEIEAQVKRKVTDLLKNAIRNPIFAAISPVGFLLGQLYGLFNTKFPPGTPLRTKVTTMLKNAVQNPIFLAISPVGGLLGQLYRLFSSKLPSGETIRKRISDAWRPALSWLDTFLRNGLPGVFGRLTSGLPGYTRTRDALFGFFAAFRDVFNRVVALWNRIDFTIVVDVPSWFSFLPPPVNALAGRRYTSPDLFPDVSYLAKGGLVTSPTLAMVGEKPGVSEAVIPLNRAGLEDAFGGALGLGDPTVNVYLDGELVRGVARVEIQQNERARAQRLTGGRR